MSQGILERIEAHQLEILSLLKGAPVAIPEKGEMLVDMLERLDPKKTSKLMPSLVEAPAESLGEMVDAELASTTAEDAADDAVEVDTDGVIWDKRIHSSNKKRSKAGAGKWMKRRGITDADYETITKELQSAAPVAAAIPPAAGLPPAPVAAGLPPAPAAGLPPAPAANVAPVVPEIPSVRQDAIKIINDLTAKLGVDYDAVIQYFIDNYNEKGFELIPASKHEGVYEDCINWFGRVTDMAAQVATIKRAYVNDVSIIEPFITACFKGARLGDLVCSSYTDVPYDQLELVEPALAALYTQCKGV